MNLRSPSVLLMLGGLPAVAAGFFVLSVSDVGRSVWMVQSGSVVLMVAIAALMTGTARQPTRLAVSWVAGLSLLLCAAPLLSDRSGPERWLTLGPLSLYIAPVVVPTLLAVAAHASRWAARWGYASAAALGAAAGILACQPDLSQVLALTTAAAFIIPRGHPWWPRALILLPLAAACGLAAMQADPLAPVGHVEQVILVSWRHSFIAGAGVSMAAIVIVATVAVGLARIDTSMAAVGPYYAVLFVCSVADMTPAPLMGYGAGPLLGFGLLAGTAEWLERARKAEV